jgi:hypothetical protein
MVWLFDIHSICHHPPPGLAFGEPDDRLQRVIQYAAAFPHDRRRLRLLGRPVMGEWKRRRPLDGYAGR